MRLLHLFVPHQRNKHRPYFLRYQILSVFVMAMLVLQTLINFYYLGTPQVLGFASNIYSDEIISLTNSERAKVGSGVVTENSLLNQAAQLKAQNMFQDNYWAHTNPSDSEKDPWYWFEQVGYTYYMAGENLAMNFDTSAGVINGWMNSASHRENMLNGNYTEIGVAVVNGVLLGEETTLVVQLFGRPVGAGAPLAQSTNPTPTPTSITAPTATPMLTPTPEPTATPIPEAVTAIVRNPSGSGPSQTNATFFGGEQKIRTVTANLMNPQSMSVGRLTMLVTLVFLILIFMVDSLVIVHRQHFHIPRSHGFVHIGVMGILFMALVYSSVGVVL